MEQEKFVSEIQDLDPQLKNLAVMQMAASLTVEWARQRTETDPTKLAEAARNYYKALRNAGF